LQYINFLNKYFKTLVIKTTQFNALHEAMELYFNPNCGYFVLQ